MPTETEIETKFELDAQSFEHLKNVSHVRTETDQLNVYYDRAWRLANHAATFRVRLSPGETPVLTLKLPISKNHGTRVVREFEFEYHLRDEPHAGAAQHSAIDVDKELPAEIDVDRELPPDVTEALLRLGVNRLERVGWVHNRRYFLTVTGFDVSIALDQLELPGGRTVYEAEIESSDPEIHVRFKCWIQSQVPEARYSPMSKFQRFRAAVTDNRRGTSPA